MFISRIVEDEEQVRRIRIELVCNLTMLSEIYVYLRSRSKYYPYLNFVDIQRFFLTDLGAGSKDMLLKATIHNFCLETCVQGAQATGEKLDDRYLLRHQFFEVMIRMAIYMYCNQSRLNFDSRFDTFKAYDTLTPSRAWYMFLNHKLKPFYERNEDI